MYDLSTHTYWRKLTIGIEETNSNKTVEGVYHCHHCLPEGAEGLSGETEEHG